MWTQEQQETKMPEAQGWEPWLHHKAKGRGDWVVPGWLNH